eukprot:COSAG02_NODE_7838_length_2824_cov_2.040734_3_plen_108_part_00
MCRIVACNRHITQERLPASRYVFLLRAETAGDTSLLFCLVRIVCTECTFFTTKVQWYQPGRISEFAHQSVSGLFMTPLAEWAWLRTDGHPVESADDGSTFFLKNLIW